MKISVTDIQTYMRCLRMWNYSSKLNRNLTRIGIGPSALELGGLIHRALAAWILEPKDNLPILFIQEANKRKAEITEAYEKVNGYPPFEDEWEPYLDLSSLGMAMMTNYQEFYKTPIPDNMEFASAEQELEIPIPNTEHHCKNCFGTGLVRVQTESIDEWYPVIKCTECNGTGKLFHILTCTLDGLLADTRGYLHVLEHKTYHPSYAPSETSLYMNQQFTRYAWGVAQSKLGQVAGIAYDGMAKKEKPARGKGLDSLFIRMPILKSEEELEQTGYDLGVIVNEIAELTSVDLYPNVPWQGCGDCSFTTVCTMQSRGEDYETYIKLNYTQRETVRIQGVRE